MRDDKIIYSTDGRNPAWCARCGKPRRECSCGRAAPSDGVVRIFRDRRHRQGKVVTVITGLPGDARALEELATTLKRLCGSGGAVKDGAVEIQGDHRDKVAAKLAALGHRVKLAGG